MAIVIDLVGWLLIGVGVSFFVTGTLALIRFPDVYSRLHALTKADNLGLGFVVFGVTLHGQSLSLALKLLLIWLLVMLASACVAYLIAGAAYRSQGH